MSNADTLALIRTRLANERTLLAWFRTGLGLAAGGAAWFRLTPDGAATGVALIGAGVIVAVVGVIRFEIVRRRLARFVG